MSELTISIKDLRSKSTFGKKMHLWKLNPLNEFGTRRLVKNFCYNLVKWWDATCFDRNMIEKSVKIKTGLLFLALKLKIHLRVNKTISGNKSNSYPQIQEHKLQNLKKVILGHLNVNFLKGKIDADEELMQNNIDTSLFLETKLEEIFSNQLIYVLHHWKYSSQNSGCWGSSQWMWS